MLFIGQFLLIVLFNSICIVLSTMDSVSNQLYRYIKIQNKNEKGLKMEFIFITNDKARGDGSKEKFPVTL